MKQLTLDTERLILRRYHSSDADQLQQIINHSDIAEMTLNIPHPYDLAMAHNWLSQLDTAWTNQQRYVYAITLKDNDTLIGTVSLSQITRDHANLGYWIGIDYWHQGYCSEAVATFIQYIFEYSHLPMVYARHLKDNPASGTVLIKNKFSYVKDEVLQTHKGLQAYSYYELYRS